MKLVAPIGLSPLTLVLSLNPFPLQAAVPIVEGEGYPSSALHHRICLQSSLRKGACFLDKGGARKTK